jgi:hypothetical protein
MRILDRSWSDLSAGYQAVHALQAKLEAEFGRAVQAGHRHRFRRQLTEWQKKRRVFLALLALAPLSVITLCVAAFYARQAACVVAYWALLVLIILVTLAVAGRSYIREAVNRPQEQHVRDLGVDLEQRWWERLAARELAAGGKGAARSPDFLGLLSESLPDSCLAVRGLPASGAMVVAPSGLWLFATRDWQGTIVRDEGAWKQRLKGHKEQVHTAGPDDEWLEQREAVAWVIQEGLPERAWTVSLVQGGVAFTGAKATPDKSRIRGNRAAYGSTRAWAERLRRAAAVDGFTTDMQLEILDALAAAGRKPEERVRSAKDEAERLYESAAEKLRKDVAEMVAQSSRGKKAQSSARR